MNENKFTIIKSPIVPMSILGEGIVIYGNQVTYSVRLANGMIVSRPEDFPSDETDKSIIMVEPNEESE